MRLLFALAALTVFSALPHAHAGTLTNCTTVVGNLVANCGFETGDFTGWTLVLGAGSYSIGIPDGTTAASGNYAAYTGDGSGDTYDALTQNIATVPGADYSITFDLYQQSEPSSAAVTFGGTQIADLLNVTGYVWQEYSYSATATAASTTLSIALGNDPYYAYLDNVIVTESAATPEPATWALMAGGTALVAAFRRRLFRAGCGPACVTTPFLS
jgi:hypothetical protein